MSAPERPARPSRKRLSDASVTALTDLAHILASIRARLDAEAPGEPSSNPYENKQKTEKDH